MSRKILSIIAGVLAAGMVYLSVALVPAGHRGVVFGQGGGVQAEELQEGLSFVLPLWQRYYNVDVRTKVFEYESFVQTSDLQEVTLPIAINYRIDPTRAAEVFQEVGRDFAGVLIPPAAFQASTEAAGQIIAEDIAVKRGELAATIQTILAERLDSYGIIVEFVSVKDAVLDAAFVAAIQAKVVAEQNVQRTEKEIQVATNEAEQARVRASGVADANATIRSSLTPDVLDYIWLTKWNGVTPLTVVSDDAGILIGVE